MDVFDLSAKITLDTSDYDSGLDKASSKASSFGSAMGGIFGAVASAVAVASGAVVAFAGKSVEVGKGFDSSMSQVVATMGYSVEELNQAGSEASQAYESLRATAELYGSTTAFTASQAADALNYMALAGYSVETSQAMLPNVLNLAAAGNMELATASDMVTDAQTALGLEIEETTAMVDEMAKTASSSNTSVSQLGEAFLTVGGLAQYMGTAEVEMADGTTKALTSTQELSTVLGILANNGIKGSEAGTHLRNMILKLSEPTDDGAKMMKKLGLEVYDTEGNMRSFQDIFADLNVAMADFTDQEKIDAFASLFNTRDIAGATALLNATAKDWNDLGSAIADAGGSAEAMAEVQLDNLEGDLTKFNSALEGAQILLSDELTPSLREFVQFGTESISELSTAFSEGGLDGLMEKMGEILSNLINMVIEKLPEVIEAGMKLLEALGKGILDNLPKILDCAIQIITMLLNGIVQALPQLLKAGIQIIAQLSSSIAQMIPELIPTIVDVMISIVETLIENVDLLIDSAIEIIMALAFALVDNLPKLIEKVPDIIVAIVGALIDNAPKLLEAALEILFVLGSSLVENVAKLISYIPDVIKSIIDKFKETDWGEIGDNIMEGIKNGISRRIESVKEAISGAVNTVIGTAKSILGIASPSKVFRQIGEFCSEGMMEGLEEMTDMSQYERDMNRSLDNLNLHSPTLSVANMGIEETKHSSSYVESINNAVNGAMQRVSEVLEDYRKDLLNMKMVLDTGVLVGEIATPMDEALGGLITMKAR